MNGQEVTEVLGNIRRGTFLAEVGEELAELLAAVRETGKAGTLTVKLKIDPMKGEGGRAEVFITDTVTVTKPKPEKSTTLMYVQDDGTLSRRDPRQGEFEGIRDVSPPGAAAAR